MPLHNLVSIIIREAIVYNDTRIIYDPATGDNSSSGPKLQLF